MQTVESGRQTLLLGGVRQQVAGELPGDKLVKGEIAVERPDDPIAVRPHGSVAIRLKTVSVGVAGQIQPIHGHAFPKTR